MQNQAEKTMKQQQISGEEVDQKQIKTSAYIPGEKNGKWSQDQHMKYIAYIDFYKEKMRSKEKRRSNQFYKQMSDFIGTRNGLQCRSHHQKLEEKYIYTNKIIAAFKEKFDVERYREELSRLKKIKGSKSISKQDDKLEDLYPVTVKFTKDVEVQTDLQGTYFNYIMADNTTVLIYPPIQGITFDSRALFYPSNFVFQPHNILSFSAPHQADKMF